VSRRRTLGALIAAVLVAASAAAVAQARPSAPTPSLATRLAAALREPGVSLRRTSALAVDLATGSVIFAHNPGLALVPASNEKLPLSYAALVRLGPGYRFRTEVLGDGVLVDRTWRGDLYLKGYGDPTLTRWDMRALAAELRRWGIRRVAGRVLGDESWFDTRRDAPGWSAWFLGEESPPLSALVVDRADGWPKLSPPLLAARALDAALERRGIAVARRPGIGTTPDDAVPLALDLSKPLSRLLRLINRDSDNFVAEMLLKALGADAGRAGTAAAGARVVRETLAEGNVPLSGLRIVDGSGLSRLDRLSSASLVAILLAAAADPDVRAPFLGSLAVAGVNGTLDRRMQRRPAYGRVIAKTGTTRLASCLSGFVRGRYAFAILQNGSPVASFAARAAQDRFATILSGV
jgi:D-alanyl-D-alanine carboxypeptidase/D-alanyl-D-alanine-endopeptidase (penicillin-binding protein 4)